MTRFIAAATAALLASATLAQAPQGPNPDPQAVQAGTYAVETTHTRVAFAVSHMGFNDWFGEFTGATGTLTIDPRNLSATQLSVSVPTASITTTNTKLDDELRSADWFDAAKYPTISFRATKVAPTGPRTARVTGDLTLHGVTKPVTLDATFNAAGPNPMTKAYTVGFHATGAIRRSDFGVKTYVPVIGDEVKLNLSAAFERKAN